MRTLLDLETLNKRASEVFELQEGDYIWDVSEEDGVVIVNMEEVEHGGDIVNFDYEPDMSERPQALDYLLGLRDDFDD